MTGIINVSLNNYAPYLITGSPLKYNLSVIDADLALDISTVFEDYENDILIYSVLDDLSSFNQISFDGDKTLNIYPSSGTLSSTEIHITATDSKNASSSTILTISIANQVPRIISMPLSIQIYDNISFSETLILSDIFIDDDGQDLMYSIADVPTFVNYIITQYQITFTGNATDAYINDTFTIVISASDGYGFCVFNYTVSVIENKPPQPPAIDQDFLLHEGDSGSISLPQFVDHEGDDIIYSCVIKDTTDN